MLKIIFFGNSILSSFYLKKLLCNNNFKVLGVITKNDKFLGRGLKNNFNEIKNIAYFNNLLLIQSDNLKDIKNKIYNLNADIIVVVDYGLIIPNEILNITKFGCINIHFSLLPKWRGAAPVQRAILAGDKYTGVTIIQMNENIDEGEILMQSSCIIDPQDNTLSLHKKLLKLGENILFKTLEQISWGSINRICQNNEQATYANKLNKLEALINWNNSAEYIERSVRAFYPWPISFFIMRNKRIRVLKSYVSKQKVHDNIIPGTILSTSKKSIDIATGKYILSIQELQPEGSRVMKVADFLNSRAKFYSPGSFIF